MQNLTYYVQRFSFVFYMIAFSANDGDELDSVLRSIVVDDSIAMPKSASNDGDDDDEAEEEDPEIRELYDELKEGKVSSESSIIFIILFPDKHSFPISLSRAVCGHN